MILSSFHVIIMADESSKAIGKAVGKAIDDRLHYYSSTMLLLRPIRLFYSLTRIQDADALPYPLSALPQG